MLLGPHHRRKVVVTGIGAITPLGHSLCISFERLWNNRNQGKKNAGTETEDYGITTLGAAYRHQGCYDDQVTEMADPRYMAGPVRGIPHDPNVPRFVQLVRLAAAEAVMDSGITCNGTEDDSFRRGVSIGVGLSSVRDIRVANLSRLNPRFVPSILPNAASAAISIDHQCRGPSHVVATACAAGAHAILDGARCIMSNDADVMLVGGTEACLDPLAVAGFSRMRALSKSGVSRPFDADRDGFVMAEGASVLVLEDETHALARNATILAEFVGYGTTADASHATAPDPQGRGAARSMEMALRRSLCDSDHDGKDRMLYVNAHATSTPLGDAVEAAAISRAVASCGQWYRQVFVSSTKGATGHLLGAAGALEAAYAVRSLVTQKLPPTLNLRFVEDSCAFSNFIHVHEDNMGVVDTAMEGLSYDTAMTNSFGFGGTNATLIFAKRH